MRSAVAASVERACAIMMEDDEGCLECVSKEPFIVNCLLKKWHQPSVQKNLFSLPREVRQKEQRSQVWPLSTTREVLP